MPTPVYKIEVWEPGGGSALYTIQSDAISVYSKEIITEGVGHFTLVLPTKTASSYIYDDIDLHDTVKIWYGYDSVSGNPDFIGKVGTISAPLKTEVGFVRQISGLSQGEILLHRLKKNTFYDAVGASTIVTEFATDLGLGAGDIAADASAITMEVHTKTYFDLLQDISDYWINAGSQVKKDFYVDVDNDLVWKARPIRTAGVETLTVGENILSYQVTQKKEPVRNDITVYGKAENYLPSDKDSWTEALDDWTASAGSLSLNNTDEQVGTYCIQCNSGGAASTNTFKLSLDRITIRTINTLSVYRWCDAMVTASYTRILAPDTSNYFQADTSTDLLWKFYTWDLGPDHIYDATEAPTEPWTETGSPNWWDIQGLQFHFTHGGNDQDSLVDGIYFYPVRYEGTASDNTSKTAYGTREREFTDEKLVSDSECEKRAETLLYQLKDPPTQIVCAVKGNTNILVGDRLSMTIPAESISAANYDVICVEHSFLNGGFFTQATMVNSANIREPIETDPARQLMNLRKHVRKLSGDEVQIR